MFLWSYIQIQYKINSLNRYGYESIIKYHYIFDNKHNSNIYFFWGGVGMSDYNNCNSLN